jgi:hypothetical protein
MIGGWRVLGLGFLDPIIAIFQAIHIVWLAGAARSVAARVDGRGAAAGGRGPDRLGRRQVPASAIWSDCDPAGGRLRLVDAEVQVATAPTSTAPPPSAVTCSAPSATRCRRSLRSQVKFRAPAAQPLAQDGVG